MFNTRKAVKLNSKRITNPVYTYCFLSTDVNGQSNNVLLILFGQALVKKTPTIIDIANAK